ncbi:MAG TPA: hypothetical protein VK183_00515 [Flavobacterium sp.]|nr:hypothetical protein [Flavobacterium sp.]
MPTREEVAEAVKRLLAEKAGIKPEDVQDSRKLTEWPLTFDSIALGFVAIDLRKYARKYNPNASVTGAMVRKTGLTVAKLIDLIYNVMQLTS